MPGPPKNFASLLRARRGYLATIGLDGTPHVVPVCFTWAGDAIWTAVDGKPKESEELQRIKDVKANSKVTFTVDRWDEDWSKLAWLQARGSASVVAKGEEAEKAKAALRDKYQQYGETPIDGPVVRIDVSRWVSWAATP
jgi:PPOX class probable F420-dependent enzyme